MTLPLALMWLAIIAGFVWSALGIVAIVLIEFGPREDGDLWR